MLDSLYFIKIRRFLFSGRLSSKRTNILTIIIIILLFILLYYDYHRVFSAGDREVLGKVIKKVKRTERRMGGRVIWDEVEIDSKVYNYDMIKTDSFSKVVVVMADLSEIELEENSIVVFKKTSSKINIDFVNGNLKLNTASSNSGTKSNINIVSGDSTIKVDNSSSLTVNKSANADMELNVDKGKVELENQNTKKEISESDVIKIHGQKVITNSRYVQLLEPVNSHYIIAHKDTEKVSFKWKELEANTKYNIEISSNEGKAIDREVKGGELSIDLKPGKYSWRIYNKELEKNNKAEVRALFIVNDTPSIPYTPDDNSNYSYTINPPRIVFSWSKNEFIDYYRLEIAKDKSFGNLVHTFTTRNTEVLIDFLQEGEYYFRVISKSGYPESQEKISTYRHFTINKNFTIESPVLVYPQDKAVLTKSNNKQSKKKDNFSLVVKHNDVYTAYEFYLSKDRNFNEILLKQKSNLPTFTLEESIAEGQYYWKVTAITMDNGKPVTSDIRTFSVQKEEVKSIKLLKPAMNSEINNPSSEFVWEQYPEASQYILEISKRSDFSGKIINYTTTSNNIRVNALPSGEYYWRVKVLAAGSMITSQEMYRIVFNSLEAPSIAYPSNNSSVDMVDKDTLILKWNYDHPSPIYEVELRKLSDNSIILKKNNYRLNSITIEDLSLLKTGMFLLTVKANIINNGEYFETATASSKFEIYLSKKITKDKIEFLTPDDLYIQE